MDVAPLVLAIPIVAIVSSTVVKIARMKMVREGQAVPRDVSARIDALEHDVRTLQEELGQAQERLDFTERLLSKAREGDRRT
jgi:hypothetical protein